MYIQAHLFIKLMCHVQWMVGVGAKEDKPTEFYARTLN